MAEGRAKANVLVRRAAAHAGRGDYDGALTLYQEALVAAPRHLGALVGATGILEAARTERYHAPLAALTARCLATEGANTEALGTTAVRQLRLRYRVPSVPGLPRAPGEVQVPDAVPFAASDDLFATLAADPLFILTLARTIVRDLAFERWLVALRGATLARLAERGPARPVAFVAVALAIQAFNTEYLWPADAAGSAVADDAAQRLAEAAVTPESDGLALDALRVALDRPLYRVAGAERLVAEPLERWPVAIRGLIERTLTEPVAEARLRGEIPALTPIRDATSASVRAMYEENPYPRWIALARNEPIDVQATLRRIYPHFAPFPRRAGPLAVLMPGAGTGQHPLSVATTYRDCQVTAVDLSLASLAYGARMAAKLGVGNVAFRHGDILELAQLGPVFEHIECVGVLHHMAEPREGLAALAACLKPGAPIRVGLYGEHARKDVVAGRVLVARLGLPPTLEGLRAFRAAVASGGDPGAASLVHHQDFFSASLLRDLVFHVQEHRYTVARLRALLDGLPLRFVGFEFSRGFAARVAADDHPARRYRETFPGDPTASDLAQWERLEAMRPGLFAGYAFWCQKTD